MWILIDVSSVCYQLFYAMDQDADGVPPAFLKRIEQIRNQFHTSVEPQLAFFFDRGKCKRKEIRSDYKEGRKYQKTDDQLASLRIFKRYIFRLAKEILPSNGYEQIYHQEGYEADDLIASACDNLNGSQAIVFSTDKDLYQCISDNVKWHNGKTVKTRSSFSKEFGIEPSQWADVLAIAGCTTDNVRGIPQIGVKSAIMFLQGRLFGWRYQRIVTGNAIWQGNLELVRLPFKGTKEIAL